MLDCFFNWHQIYIEQFPSYAGNKAVVVEIQNNQTDSAVFAASEIERLGLGGSLKYWTCKDEESEKFAENFKNGECSFVLIDGVHTYDRTMANLRTYYPLVHYNSAIAGHGIRIPEVMRAVEEFAAEKRVPWRIINECWMINHCHRPDQILG